MHEEDLFTIDEIGKWFTDYILLDPNLEEAKPHNNALKIALSHLRCEEDSLKA